MENAVETAPTKSTHHYHPGLAYQKSHDEAHAKEQFVRALQLNPPQPKADEIRKALGGNSGT